MKYSENIVLLEILGLNKNPWPLSNMLPVKFTINKSLRNIVFSDMLKFLLYCGGLVEHKSFILNCRIRPLSPYI